MPRAAKLLRRLGLSSSIDHPGKACILCTAEFVSELDQTTKPLFTQLEATPSETPGLMLGRGATAVIRKNEHDEPIEARLFKPS